MENSLNRLESCLSAAKFPMSYVLYESYLSLKSSHHLGDSLFSRFACIATYSGLDFAELLSFSIVFLHVVVGVVNPSGIEFASPSPSISCRVLVEESGFP